LEEQLADVVDNESNEV
jgi:hypothetical protein